MDKRKTFQDRVLDTVALLVVTGIGLTLLIIFIDKLPGA